jgi:hypothetical protein
MEDVIRRPADLKRLADIQLNGLEPRVPAKVCKVSAATGDEIVHRYNFPILLQEVFAEMGTQKTCSAGNDCSHGIS